MAGVLRAAGLSVEIHDDHFAQDAPDPVFAKHIRGHLDAYLSATQLGVTLASLALGWIGEQFMARMLQPV